jgi:hypothetical protein
MGAGQISAKLSAVPTLQPSTVGFGDSHAPSATFFILMRLGEFNGLFVILPTFAAPGIGFSGS